MHIALYYDSTPEEMATGRADFKKDLTFDKPKNFTDIPTYIYTELCLRG
jgi:hypothetical protein